MKKKLLWIATLALAFVSTNVSAYEMLQKKSLRTEITSIEELAKSSFILNDASGMYLYTPSGWDIKVCDEATFNESQTTGGLYKLEPLGDNWIIPVFDLTGEPRTTNENWYKGNQFVNAQPTGNVIFGLAGDNAQHGQDGQNLAVWDITYTADKGFAFHCVGRDIYIGHDGTAARPVSDIYYWNATAQTLTYDVNEVEATYNEIKDLAMSVAVKTAMDDAKAQYDADNNNENLDKYAETVNAAIKNVIINDVTPGSDKTIAIVNPGAEDGKATPWTVSGRIIDNKNNAHSGQYLFETAGWGPEHGELTQTIEGLPAGKYELSVYFMGATETYAKLHGNNEVSEEVKGSGDAGDDRWKAMSVVCNVEEDGKLVILAETNTTEKENWGNFDDFSLKYLCAFNTIPAGMYAIKAEVAVAEGKPEAAVPTEFKKYLGTYNTNATIDGDKKSLVITENKENGLFNGFEIEGDAVKFSPEKTIFLNGKTFTVRASGNEAETGTLAITATEDGYKMENADIYYNGIKVITVSDIVITKATEEVVWKVTYVDYDKADEAMGDLTNSTSLSGYNVIKDGEVTLGRTDWGANYLTYILVDAYTMQGVVKKATLKAKVSGSLDNKRTTTWGVGYNNSDWSANMTWNTADKSITNVGELFNGTTKSASTFQDAEFDITDAFADDNKVKTILLYETAAAGGYVKDITVEIEMAASKLDAMKAKYIEAAEKLPAGDGLFCYPTDALEEYKAAVNAAETVEEIEAIELPAQNLPDAEAYYNFENKTAEGLYLNGTNISSTKGEIKLEAAANGYYIKFDEGYLNVKSNSTWDMELSETPVTVWTINSVNGFYTLQNSNGLLGSDSTADGSSVYANKSADKNGYWIITKSDVTAVDAIKTIEVAVSSTKKYVGKDGIVIEKNGVKYNAAGQLK